MIPTYITRIVPAHQDVRPSITERGFIYNLHKARVMDALFVSALYRLGCR